MSVSLQRHFTLRPSRYSYGFLAAACLISIFFLLKLPVNIGWQVISCLLVVAACVFVLLRDVRLVLARSCIAFRLESKHVITLMQRDGRHVSGTVMTGGVVLPLIVLLSVQLDGGGRRSLWLMEDSMNVNSFRRLRMMLRWGE